MSAGLEKETDAQAVKVDNTIASKDCQVFSDDFSDPDSDEFKRLVAQEKPADEDTGGKKSQATTIVEMAMDTFDFAATPKGDAFAVRKGAAPIALSFRGGRRSLKAELSKMYAEQHESVPNSSALTDALLNLTGIAQSGELIELPLRVAHCENGLLLDLGRDDGLSVKITDNSWELSKEPGVIWRRTNLTREMQVPIHGGSLDELWKLTNFAVESRPMVLAWLVSALMPEIPHPILLITGVQGTAKTTSAQALVELVDASTSPMRTVPRDIKDWAVAASGSWVTAIDNISSIQNWFADALCRAVTGDGLVTRQLYSDDELSVLSFRRAIILTAIDIGVLRGDLAERLLRVQLEQVPPECRLEERLVRQQILDAAPRVLGALLDLTVKVLAVLPTLQLERLPRMADFGKVLAAVDAVLGTDGIDQYYIQAQDIFGDVVEGDEVGKAIMDLLENCEGGTWTGRASELLVDMMPTNPSKYWPGNAKALSSKLRNAHVALQAVGIDVVMTKTHGTRYIRLKRRPLAESAAA